MVTCRDIHERIRRGETPSSEAERAHLDECEACRELAAEDGQLGRALGSPEELDLAGVREALAAEIEADVGPIAYLRSRSTPVRLSVTFVLAAVIALAVLLFSPRPDLHLYPELRLALAVTALVLPLLVGLVVVLRPLQQRALPPALVWSTLGVAVAAPWFLASLPQAHRLHPAALQGVGAELLPFAVRCLVFGLVSGLPLLFALRFFDRGAHAALRRALVAAAVAGVLGNLSLMAHCPITAPAHLALGHATVGVTLVGAYLLAALRRR